MKKLTFIGIPLRLLLGLVLCTVGLATRAVAEDYNFIVTSNDEAELRLIIDKAEVLYVLSGGTAASTITFAPNVTGTITLTMGELVIKSDLTIIGPGANLLTISGNNLSRVFYITPTITPIPRINTVTLKGLTVAGGNGVGAILSSTGGGILNNGSTLSLTNCTVSANSSDFNAGGISNVGGTLSLTNCTVSGNSAAGNGGGIHSQSNGTVTVTNSTVSGNSAFIAGGGIYNIDDGMVTITNSTVSGNSVEAPVDGGLGGGIINFTGTVTVTNCTVSANSASTFGGGIINGGMMTLTNCTVTGNRADSDGDAFGSGGGIAPAGTETLNNTIVAGNFVGVGSTPDDIIITFGTIETANNNIIGDAATAGGITNGVNGNKVGFAVSAVLNTTLANNGGPTKTHALVCGSPAIDAGSNALALDASSNPLTTDQRGTGFLRTLDGNGDSTPVVDIGAFEALFNNPPTITGATIARQAGSPVSSSQIATVTDTESGAGGVTVTVTSANPSNGVTVSNIVNNYGSITADVVANCTATNASFTLTVTDGYCATVATLNVTVGANTPPTLGTYSNTSVSPGSSTTVTPTAAPSDNGSISSSTATAPGFTGTLSINAAGVVSIGNAGPAGNYVVTVTLTDNCGAQTVRTFNLSVTSQFNFVGFFQPVDNLPTVNSVNAGQSIPVKFSLTGYQGMNIFATGFPASQAIACSNGTPDLIEETATAGASGLSYDATTDRYTYVWKTEKAWKGTCRKLVVKFTDGTMKEALFQFK
jgi:parallel beta-helix repeat protein